MKDDRTQIQKDTDILQNLLITTQFLIECIDSLEFETQLWVRKLKHKAKALRTECESVTGNIYTRYLKDNPELDKYHHDQLNNIERLLSIISKYNISRLKFSIDVLEAIEKEEYAIAATENLSEQKAVQKAVKNYGLLLAALPDGLDHLGIDNHKEIYNQAKTLV